MRLPYKTRTVITTIRRCIKRVFQRGARGWADEDAWGIYIWMSKMLPSMLRKVADEGDGYPVSFSPGPDDGMPHDADFDTEYAAWKAALYDAADMLEEACAQTCKRKNPVPFPGWPHTEYRDDWDRWSAAEAELENYHVECKNKAMKFLTENWYSLGW